MLKYIRKDKHLRIPVGIGTNNNVDSSLLFNVSDGDATAEDLVAGKTAYSAEGFIVGTLDVEGEKTSSYNEGYSAGEQDGYVSGEADGYADGYAEGKEDGIEEIISEQSDANITPGRVLEGYIGYGANNERIVGTNVGGFDFGEIGYTEEENNELNSQLKEPLEYTKSLMPVTPSVSMNRKFSGNKELVYAPGIDTSITTDMSYMFYECTNLQYVPQYDYSNVTTVEQMFAYAGGPKEIDFSFDNNIGNFNQIISYNTGTEKLVINAANVSRANSLYRIAYGSKIKHFEVFNIPNVVTDLRSITQNCYSLEYFKLSGDTSNVSPITSEYDFRFTDFNILHTVIFDIDTHFLRTCYNFFENCNTLINISQFNTSNVTNMRYMFNRCSSLTSVPLFDTSNVTDMGSMFSGCSSLTTVPAFNTSNVTNMSYMFQSCSSLTTVPLFNTSNVTNMSTMFNGCSSLTTVPLFDTSNVTTMDNMFNRCSSLTSVPLFDTSNVTRMDSMFSGCSSLTTVPLFNTSNVTTMNGMFYGCKSLERVPLLDAGKVTNVVSIFFGISNSLTDLGGFKDLGKAYTSTGCTLALANLGNITRDSLLNIFNNLYNVSGKSYSFAITLNTSRVNLLSDEDKAIATNKGWSIIIA